MRTMLARFCLLAALAPSAAGASSILYLEHLRSVRIATAFCTRDFCNPGTDAVFEAPDPAFSHWSITRTGGTFLASDVSQTSMLDSSEITMAGTAVTTRLDCVIPFADCSFVVVQSLLDVRFAVSENTAFTLTGSGDPSLSSLSISLSRFDESGIDSDLIFLNEPLVASASFQGTLLAGERYWFVANARATSDVGFQSAMRNVTVRFQLVPEARTLAPFAIGLATLGARKARRADRR